MSGTDGVMLHPDRVKATAGDIEGNAHGILDELNRAEHVPAPTLRDFGKLNEDIANGRRDEEFSANALAEVREHAELLAGVSELLAKYSDAVVNTDQAHRARIAALHRPR